MSTQAPLTREEILDMVDDLETWVWDTGEDEISQRRLLLLQFLRIVSNDGWIVSSRED